MRTESGIEVTVNTQTAPHQGYTQKMTTDMAAGSGGDVVWISPFQAAIFHETEFLLDLTPLVNKWAGWKHFYPSLKKMYEWDGKWGLDTSHLIARSDALIGDYAAHPFMNWATSCLEYAVPKPFSPDFKRYNDSMAEVLNNYLDKYRYLVELGKSPEECIKRFGELLIEKGIEAEKLKDM